MPAGDTGPQQLQPYYTQQYYHLHCCSDELSFMPIYYAQLFKVHIYRVCMYAHQLSPGPFMASFDVDFFQKGSKSFARNLLDQGKRKRKGKYESTLEIRLYATLVLKPLTRLEIPMNKKLQSAADPEKNSGVCGFQRLTKKILVVDNACCKVQKWLSFKT